MKSCPTCNRTYPDDTLAFCLVDGSVLSAPYDPRDSDNGAVRRGDNSTQTQILNPTVPSEPAPPIEPTIRAALPQVPSLQSGSRPELRYEEHEQRKSKAPWIIAALPVLMAGVLGIVLLASRFIGKSDKPQPPSNSNVGTKVESRSNLACNHLLTSALYDKWIEMGGEHGRFGCPLDADSDAPASPQGTTARWVRFNGGDGGYLIQHGWGKYDGKAFEVSGCMFKLYSSLGGTKSWLGLPVSDGRETRTGSRQDFEGGYVLWDSKTYGCQAYRN